MRDHVMKTKHSRGFIRICSMLSGMIIWFAAGQALALNIDTFDTSQLALVVTTSGVAAFGTVGDGVATNIMGGERDMLVYCTSGCTGPTTRIFGEVSGVDPDSVFRHSQDQGVVGSTLLTWDGYDSDGFTLDPTGLGGVDLTAGGSEVGFQYSIIEDDVPAKMTFKVFTDSSNVSEFVVTLGGSVSYQNYAFAYADFAPVIGTGADFTNVGAIQLSVESLGTSLDFSLDFLGTIDACNADCIPNEVPEPGTWILFGTGLLGIVSYAWRRNKHMA